MHPRGLELRQLLVGRHGSSRVRADREPRGQMRGRTGTDELALDVAQYAPVETQLDETGPDFGAVDAVLELPDPAFGQCLVRLVAHILRQKTIVEGRVVPGGGENVQPARL